MNKYLKDYKWENIKAMIHNDKLDPKKCELDFTNRLVVITGATSGIGYDTAMKYASHGADLLCINRNEKKSEKLCESLKKLYNTKCSYIVADFTKLAEVHDAAKQLSLLERDIDVLIHNAGIFMTKKTFTEDNLELVFQTNYLSSFILNYYLKEKLINQNSCRIIYVNSEGHRFAISGVHFEDLSWHRHFYSGLKSYGAAKTAQLLSMIKWKEYFTGTGVTVNAMHPGNVKTQMGENNGKIYKLSKRLLVDKTAKSSVISAEALYSLGRDSQFDNISGKFFNLTTEEEPAPHALDKDAAEKLWVLSHTLSGLKEKSK